MKLTELKKMTPAALNNMRLDLESKATKLSSEMKAVKKSIRAIRHAEQFHRNAELDRKRSELGLKIVQALEARDIPEADRLRAEIVALKKA